MFLAFFIRVWIGIGEFHSVGPAAKKELEGQYELAVFVDVQIFDLVLESFPLSAIEAIDRSILLRSF